MGGNRKNILVYNKPNPKIALFGHMDTVLPKVETDRPFEPREEGDKLFGLGAVDMKSGLAIMLKLMTEIQNDELAFVFSVDEEYDFKGALKLKEISDFKPEFIVNVEPTDGKILNGCRGITEFGFEVHGKSAHAGRKEFGVNAIEKAVELIQKFQKRCSELDLGDGGKTTVNLAYIQGGVLKDNGDGSSEVSGLGNIVPNYAKVVCEIRIANQDINQEFVKEEVIKISEEIGVTVKIDLKVLEKAIRDTGEEVVYADISLAGYYEVQMLQDNWGCKSVVFGVSPINLSHSANEYLLLSTLEKVENILRNFIEGCTSVNA